MTALQLVNRILMEKLRFDTVTTLAGAAGITSLVLWSINEIQRRLFDAADWKRLKKQSHITLVANQELYSLASDVHRLLRIYYQIDDGLSDSVPKITLVGDDAWVEHKAVDTVTGRPYIAREFGLDSNNFKQLQVYYSPNSANAGAKVYYEYIRAVADLVNDNDRSPFDDHWLIDGGSMMIKSSQGDLSAQDISSFIDSIVKGLYREGKRVRFMTYRDY